MKNSMNLLLILSVIFPAVSSAQSGSMVSITPLGSHAGEFCRNDRAMLFEDPTGLRILWDPGRTIDGGTDPRLGDIHVIILSSVHSDHIGERKPNPGSPGSCANPGTVSAAPNSNTAQIAAAKNSVVFTGGEMPDFLSRKIENIRGAATPGCPTAVLSNETTAPRTSPCVATLRPGGSRTVRLSDATRGVKFANIRAFHSNGIPPELIDSPGVAPGTTGYGGNDGGAIIQFTNGLRIYLTADTGLDGDMDTIVRRFYKPDLVVINMGDLFSLGPEEAAFAVKVLIQPRTVIPSHANEAATTGGVVNPGTRLGRFIQQVNVSDAENWIGRLIQQASRPEVIVPLSGVTIRCDGEGRCN